MSWTYRKAGVDIDVKTRLIEQIKPSIRRTHREGVIGDIGGFGGLFSLAGQKHADPVLVSSTDGVGTKLRIAFATGRHEGVGIDLVAMSVNDVAVTGAEPLFFLDYFATGKLDPEVTARVIESIARGCEEAGCALIGGETAELPDSYPEGEYDLAGFCVGIGDRQRLLDGSRVEKGDRVVGLHSSGLHSNGFSLARRIVDQEWSYEQTPQGLDQTWAEALLAPTRIYVRALHALHSRDLLHAAAHITGGGWYENIPRVLPEGLGVRVRRGTWSVPPVFTVLQEAGEIADREMFRTFNMGVGMVCFIGAAREAEAMAALRAAGESPQILGEVVQAGEARVSFEDRG